MELIVLILAGVLEIVGVTLMVSAIRYRTPEHPAVPSWNPKDWRPVWTVRSWYSQRGFRMQLVGTSMLVTGVLIHLLWSLLR